MIAEPNLAEVTEREPSGYIADESRWEDYVSVSHGTFPTFWNFYTAFNTVRADSDYLFSFGNDPYVGTDKLTCDQLWDIVVRVWNSSHVLDLTRVDTERAQLWVSDILGVLGWEWV